MILGMMVLPLPPFLLDLFFTFNIAFSVMVLLVSMYTKKPLDFSVFPTVLLVTTLLRLSLNVASTRIVLLEGHTGPDAAGKVIEAFGHFLVGGNYAVGLVVFVILTMINFVVITKGAGRIAEVGALHPRRHARQADGHRRRPQCRPDRRGRGPQAPRRDRPGGGLLRLDGRRLEVRPRRCHGRHHDPLHQHPRRPHRRRAAARHGTGDAAQNYTLLTIGDGLVAQIPALIISTAAGLVVSRVGTDEDIGQQMSASSSPTRRC
jgi:flagellar biosynthesis protein FlhA